ncbi:MAG: hypothetical protein HY900_23850 [Deltaproteobacteria bacterium]|nr:hypothetical protein [Deltaproteobacteria bacterium]
MERYEEREPTGSTTAEGPRVRATLTDGVIGALRAVGDIEAELLGLLRNTVSGTLRSAGAVASEGVGVVQNVLTGAVQATQTVGTEVVGGARNLAADLTAGAADVLVGVVGGVRDVATAAVSPGVARPRRTAETAGRPAGTRSEAAHTEPTEPVVAASEVPPTPTPVPGGDTVEPAGGEPEAQRRGQWRSGSRESEGL